MDKYKTRLLNKVDTNRIELVNLLNYCARTNNYECFKETLDENLIKGFESFKIDDSNQFPNLLQIRKLGSLI